MLAQQQQHDLQLRQYAQRVAVLAPALRLDLGEQPREVGDSAVRLQQRGHRRPLALPLDKSLRPGRERLRMHRLQQVLRDTRRAVFLARLQQGAQMHRLQQRREQQHPALAGRTPLRRRLVGEYRREELAQRPVAVQGIAAGVVARLPRELAAPVVRQPGGAVPVRTQRIGIEPHADAALRIGRRERDRKCGVIERTRKQAVHGLAIPVLHGNPLIWSA